MIKLNPRSDNRLPRVWSMFLRGLQTWAQSGGAANFPASPRPGLARKCAAVFILIGAVFSCGSAFASRVSDVTHTKHNLGLTGPGPVTVDPTKEWMVEVCVFCHTPHGATLGARPLWNRALSTATYTPYAATSLDATYIQGVLGQPGGSSKLCLSCHDGTLAIGNVNVLFGIGPVDTIWKMSMLGVVGNDTQGYGGKMPYGGAGTVSGTASGVLTGYTRNLGIDLSNDHPISVNYTSALSQRDGELRGLNASQQSVASGAGGYYTVGKIVGIRSSGYRPLAPLEPTGVGNVGQVQCSACHDPHLRETDPKVGNQKFLMLNRFQETPPTREYDGFNDIGCVACHDKNFTTTPAPTNTNAGTWAYSAHANPQVSLVPQTYKLAAAQMNEFPTTADGAATNLPMWKASCLNCHDTHSVQGSRWLLREGTTDQNAAGQPKVGGTSAIEETCYQCHSGTSNVENGNIAADIKTDMLAATHMPITLADQQGNVQATGSPATEVHDIGGNFPSGGTPAESVDCSTLTNKCGADFVESRTKLGRGSLTTLYANRHAECTDCHNPHRTVKFQSFEGNPPGSLSGAPDAQSTHKHTNTTGYAHTNIASGALRGTFGVEPTYVSESFNVLPSDSFSVKRGDPIGTLGVTDCTSPTNRTTCDGKGYVTREYQVCLKCHSNYAYNDSNTYPYADLPKLGGTGLTPSGAAGNGMTYYTNQAREFQAPYNHMGEVSGVPPVQSGGASATYSTAPQTNERSWHPVMDKTGRSGALRGNVSGGGTDISANFTLPWSNAVGTQTMYCDDCHGSNVTTAASVIPNNAQAAWGTHGSINKFLLKGDWSINTGLTAVEANSLCFKCHDQNTYAGGGGARTGFWIAPLPNPDIGANSDGHALHFARMGNRVRCSWCHVAVPHGWKNKGLLVNLNDVGPEGGQVAGTQVRNKTTAAYSTIADGYAGAPYYLNAMLKVINFKPSGQWTAADCGSAGAPGNGQSGLTWMKDYGLGQNTENCSTPP